MTQEPQVGQGPKFSSPSPGRATGADSEALCPCACPLPYSLGTHLPLKPEFQAGMPQRFDTPQQFWPQQPLEQAVGQEDEDHTGEDEQCQGPLEIQDAGCQQEGSICCEKVEDETEKGLWIPTEASL